MENILEGVIFAIIQGVTEFLPISSSGHLALFSRFFQEPNLFLFTVLHFASLLAILIYTRNEIKKIFKLDYESKKLIKFLVIATIPAVLVGFFFKGLIEGSFSSLLFLGFGFLITGIVVSMTRFVKPAQESKLSALWVGLFQAAAIFPGISRSGMSISGAIFSGISKESAARTSFLLFIPLALGAMVLEIGNFYWDASLILSFIICFAISLLFLRLLDKLVRNGYFWIFGIYCLILGAGCLIEYFL